MEREIMKIKKDMVINPISYLVEHGAFQNMVEDVKGGGQGEGELLKALKNVSPKVDQLLDTADQMIPNKLTAVYDQIVLSPNTALSHLLANVVQYSDLVSRYAVWSYKTETDAMTKQEAFNLVMDIFVNYEDPTSVQMQWLNDNGVLQFTKFMFRIQRVIYRNIEQAPALMLGSEIMQRMLVDIPDPTDSILTWNTFINHANMLGSPDIWDQAFQANLFNQHEYLTDLPDLLTQ